MSYYYCSPSCSYCGSNTAISQMCCCIHFGSFAPTPAISSSCSKHCWYLCYTSFYLSSCQPSSQNCYNYYIFCRCFCFGGCSSWSWHSCAYYVANRHCAHCCFVCCTFSSWTCCCIDPFFRTPHLCCKSGGLIACPQYLYLSPSSSA